MRGSARGRCTAPLRCTSLTDEHAKGCCAVGVPRPAAGSTAETWAALCLQLQKWQRISHHLKFCGILVYYIHALTCTNKCTAYCIIMFTMCGLPRARGRKLAATVRLPSVPPKRAVRVGQRLHRRAPPLLSRRMRSEAVQPTPACTPMIPGVFRQFQTA